MTNSIQDTINKTANAMYRGVTPVLIKQILLNDGFLPKQVEVMMRWAKQIKNIKVEEEAANKRARNI